MKRKRKRKVRSVKHDRDEELYSPRKLKGQGRAKLKIKLPEGHYQPKVKEENPS